MTRTTRRHLGEILRLERRKVHVDPVLEYQEIGIRSFGKGIFHKQPVLGAALGEKRVFAIEPGDLILSNVFAWEGAVSVAEESEQGMIGSHRFMTYVPHTVDVDVRFLNFLFRSDAGLMLLGQASPGSAGRNRTLNIDLFAKLEIDLPELDEQRRIADYLSGVLGLAATLEPRFRPESVDALVGLYPAVAERYLAAFAAGYKRLADIVDFVSDVVHPGEDPRPADVFVGLQHIQSHTGQRIGEDAIGEEKGRKLRFARGDVVYGYLRPYLNKVWVADRHGLCSVDQYVLRPKEGISAELLAHAMRSRRFLLEAIELTHRLQLPRLRSGPLGRIEVPVVPSEAAEHLLASLDAILGRVLSLRDLRVRQKGHSQALEASVLHAAFGE